MTILKERQSLLKKNKLRRTEIDRRYVLPEEIMNQIISKLPTKYLLRFKTLSKKQWYSLISHPNFVQFQLKRALSDQKLMALSSKRSRFYLLNHDGRTVHHKFNLPFSPRTPDRVHLLGSCNGLLCLGIYSKFGDHWSTKFGAFYNPILWNPLSNDYKKVPFNVSNVINLFGFGYDSHTEDYKFVRIKLDEGEAEIYSLKSNSIRRVPFELGEHSHYFAMVTVVCRFYNGSLYWHFFFKNKGEPLSYSESAFVVFDLRYEKFRFLKFPTSYTSPHRAFNFTISSDCDRLGVFICDPENNEYFNLVTMKEDSENDSISWSTTEIRHPKGNLSWPICFLMSGDILVRLNNHFPDPRDPQNDLFIYNPQQRTTKKVAIHGAKHWSKYTTFIPTLVSPSKLS